MVFGLTQIWTETRAEHTNHYTDDAVCICGLIVVIVKQAVL